MSFIRTVKGDVPIESLGLMLPHEHLFVDLRGPLAEGYGQGEPQAVSDLLQPYLDHAQALGVTALVDCGPIGVGRNIAVLRHLANITPIHIIAPTGIYKEAFIPPDKFGHTAKQLAAEWINEITTGIDGSESRAGFIKVAVSDDGPTPLEVRNLQAAVLASRSTGATVGCPGQPSAVIPSAGPPRCEIWMSSRLPGMTCAASSGFTHIRNRTLESISRRPGAVSTWNSTPSVP